MGFLWPEMDEERARAALSQALYTLRRDLRSEEVIEGTATLRLNEEVLPSDIGLFRRAIAEGRFAAAAEMYTGAFLDGVHLPGAEEFERWADEERRRLAREAAAAFEKAAAGASAAGDHAAAAAWWRRRAALDPVEAGAAVGLMNSLVAAGDRAAALQHARVYETLVTEQLGVAPDASVRRLVDEIRRTKSVREPERRSVEVAPASPADRRTERRVIIGLLAVAAALVIVLFRRLPAPAPRAPAAEVIAVGAFRAYGPDAQQLASPVGDMLATNLATAPGLTVLSSGRLLELAGPAGADTAGLLRAARTAGATMLLDGALYRRGDSIRLDVRRTDLISGTVAAAVTVSAVDVFSAVDSATAQLLRTLGKHAPSHSIAAVTTSSIVAYRLYVEGLNAFYANRREAALRLFTAAVAEDSGFAMAEHYAGLASVRGPEQAAHAQRATQLAGRATERERLLIHWYWARWNDDVSSLPLAESLVTRFSAEPFAHIAYGHALVQSGSFGEAARHFRMAWDREKGRGLDLTPGACISCEARSSLAHALRLADSSNAALVELRRWTEDEPRRQEAWGIYADALLHAGRYEEALAAGETAAELGPDFDLPLLRMRVNMRRGNFGEADRWLLERLRSGSPDLRYEALWNLTFSYRAQGRLADAMETARALREGRPDYGQQGAAPYEALQMAAVLFEARRYREAAALFDSIGVLRVPTETASRHARHAIWLLSLASTALAAAGDTAELAARADSIELLSRHSAYGRDHRLHHHVRGLLYAARGDHALAAESFRRSIYSPVTGYTRTNMELAESLIRAGRPREAVAPLQSALRGPVDGTNTYVSRTDILEQLALAWMAAGDRARSREYAGQALAAWAQADGAFAERVQRLRRLQ